MPASVVPPRFLRRSLHLAPLRIATLALWLDVGLVASACGGGPVPDDAGVDGARDARSDARTSDATVEPDAPDGRADGSSGRDGGSDAGPLPPPPPGFDFPGVPYPHPGVRNLPEGIMPTLPTPNRVEGWSGYDPVAVPSPGVEDCDTTFGAGDAVPRNVVLSPGETWCFTGMAEAARTIRVDASACTAEAPCWFVGMDGGGIAAEGVPAIAVRGSHMIFDALRLDIVRAGIDILGGSDHIVVRGCQMTGNGSDGGGAGVDIAGEEGQEIHHILVYRNQFDEIGPSDGGPSGAEALQVRPSWYARYVWVVGNVFGDSDSDAVQCGNSKRPGERRTEGMNAEKSPHYIWIAGNIKTGVSENFVDLKNSYHVIISSNDVRTPQRETTIILSQDGEGFWTGHHWAIANRIQGSGWECIGVRGNEENFFGTFTDYNYVIANVAYNCGRGLLTFNSGNSATAGVETYVLYNTLVSNIDPPFTVRAPISKPQNRQERIVEFIGNIIYGNFNPLGGSGGASYITANGYLTETFIAYDNIYYQVDGVDFPFLSRIDATTLLEEGNMNVDPMFVDEAAGDFRLAPGSPAREATRRGSVAFDRFRDYYGIDLQEQLGLTGVNNIGAIQ